MSSIDKKELLTRFYRDNILSRHVQESSRRTEQSAYIQRKQQTLKKDDLELDLDDVSAIGAVLDEFWMNTPLNGLGKKLAELSVEFYDIEESEKMSTSIYEMF